METVQAKTDWRSAPRQFYSPEFKLKLVQLALQPGTSVADVARRHNVNDNLLFKWIRLFQREGQVTRRQSKIGHTPSAPHFYLFISPKIPLRPVPRSSLRWRTPVPAMSPLPGDA